MNTERKWCGRWINAGRSMISPTPTSTSAPYLRKTVICSEKPQKAAIFLCGLGFHILYVNGQKVDNRLLAPTVTQFDSHVSYIEYEIGRAHV